LMDWRSIMPTEKVWRPRRPGDLAPPESALVKSLKATQAAGKLPQNLKLQVKPPSEAQVQAILKRHGLDEGAPSGEAPPK
jgi:hypothetical protein